MVLSNVINLLKYESMANALHIYQQAAPPKGKMMGRMLDMHIKLVPGSGYYPITPVAGGLGSIPVSSICM